MIRPADVLAEPLRGKYAALVASLRSFDRVVVAYSGGVDSTFLLRAAANALGPRTRAVIGVSPSLAPEMLERARRVARTIRVELREIETAEMDDPLYVANAPDRCFHCKKVLFSLLTRLAREASGATVLDGTNHDDLADVRPGMKAALEAGVRSPLLEGGWSKAEIREASRILGLETWDRPASPCLASRIPHGTPVTAEVLTQVGVAERALRGLGFEDVRVRHHGTRARLEVPAADLERLLEAEEQASAAVRAAGYVEVTIDRAGYRRGGAQARSEEGSRA